MLKIRNLFIEGSDCSGKTTLIEEIHKKTRYRYHIMDRSQLSRSVFNDLYDRDIDIAMNDFERELHDLNNFYVLLIPPWAVVESRFDRRGDDKHDRESLKVVYNAFFRKADELREYPNVLVVHEFGMICDSIVHKLQKYETAEDISVVSDRIIESVSARATREINGLKFDLFAMAPFDAPDRSIMLHEPEKRYYSGILRKTLKKIDDELSGINEYSRCETVSSRRFIYTDDTCISFIHAYVRSETLNIHAVCRSSDVVNVFPYDIKFIHYLSHKVREILCRDISKVRIKFELNSAHIVDSIE